MIKDDSSRGLCLIFGGIVSEPPVPIFGKIGTSGSQVCLSVSVTVLGVLLFICYYHKKIPNKWTRKSINQTSQYKNEQRNRLYQYCAASKAARSFMAWFGIII